MKSKSNILTVSLVFLLVIAIGAIVYLILAKGNAGLLPGETTISQSDNGGLVVPERPEMIDITAYESIELKADTLEQSVSFDNPLQNNCWLVITLELEDGTILWTSEELQPGQVVRSITLNQPLTAGEYNNAVLRYQHWTYDDAKEPLNGAETVLTIKVN